MALAPEGPSPPPPPARGQQRALRGKRPPPPPRRRPRCCPRRRPRNGRGWAGDGGAGLDWSATPDALKMAERWPAAYFSGIRAGKLVAGLRGERGIRLESLILCLQHSRNTNWCLFKLHRECLLTLCRCFAW